MVTDDCVCPKCSDKEWCERIVTDCVCPKCLEKKPVNWKNIQLYFRSLNTNCKVFEPLECDMCRKLIWSDCEYYSWPKHKRRLKLERYRLKMDECWMMLPVELVMKIVGGTKGFKKILKT